MSTQNDEMETFSTFKDQIESLDTRARQLVKDQPLTVLGGILLLGYACGWLLARR